MRSISFSADGRLIATTSDDNTAAIWKTELPPHVDRDRSLAELVREGKSALPMTLSEEQRTRLVSE